MITARSTTLLIFLSCAATSIKPASSDVLVQVLNYNFGAHDAFKCLLPTVDLARPAQVSIVNHVVRRGDSFALQSLLAHKADVNEQERHSNKTPLHTAAQESNPELAQLLIRHRANINSLDSLGNTPLITACTSWGRTIRGPTTPQESIQAYQLERSKTIERNVATVQILLNHPATDLHAVSVLHNALCALSTWELLEADHIPLIKRMLQLGMNPNGRLVTRADGSQAKQFSICATYTDQDGRRCKPRDKSVCKSVLMALNAHRTTVEQTAAAIADSTKLPLALRTLTTHYLYTSPDNKELDDALDAYKTVKPASLRINSTESKKNDITH